MSALPVAQKLHPAGRWTGRAGVCALDYEGRFFRRRRLDTSAGWSFIADFAHTVSLGHGDALELGDGRLVEIVAAPERLLAVTGSGLARLAWHIGNRHTPCHSLRRFGRRCNHRRRSRRSNRARRRLLTTLPFPTCTATWTAPRSHQPT